MGCDIHSYPERKVDGQWMACEGTFGTEKYPDVEPFAWRDYSVFAFLAGVRNYSDVIPITEPRGLLDDVSQYVANEYETWGCDAHTPSWLSVAELNAFDYDKSMEDRRVIRNGDGGCTADPGDGKSMTYREFLGPFFFSDLAELNRIGAERVVFWFDN